MPRGPVNKRIPTTVQNQLGRGKLEKGRWNDIYVWAWDFAEECIHEDCPLFDICVYKDYWHAKKEGKGKPGYTNKCMLQQRYLKNVLHAVMETMQNKREVTTENMMRMGYQMLPLYAQLFKFKMYEYGMTGNDLVYTSEKGAKKINPVYKEIREIVKTIEGIWNKVGGSSKNKKKASDIGDGSYIDAMYEVVGGGEQQSDEEEEEEVNEDGTGIDFSAFEQPEEKPKKKKKTATKKRRKTK